MTLNELLDKILEIENYIKESSDYIEVLFAEINQFGKLLVNQQMDVADYIFKRISNKANVEIRMEEVKEYTLELRMLQNKLKSNPDKYKNNENSNT